MRLSPTITFYIGRQFFFGVMATFVIFLGLVIIFDAVELLRRASDFSDVGIGDVLKMTFLKAPDMALKLLPFALLFGGMTVFWRLTRNHELVVTRATGVSVWQTLLPPLAVALVLGVVHTGALSPLAAITTAKFEQLEATMLRRQLNQLDINKSGVFLRQSDPAGESVIIGERVFQQGKRVEIGTVHIVRYDDNKSFRERIFAEKAVLDGDTWQLTNGMKYDTQGNGEAFQQRRMATDLTLEKIQESFAPPETISFWELPAFINTLRDAGFSAVRHRLHWHVLLAAPLLFCALVLIAAAFTLRHSTRRNLGIVVVTGIGAGLLLFFAQEVIFALGLSDSIPVILAAWTPAGVTMLLGLTSLLHLEDG